ncbi:MAG: hypothetical protein JNK08_00890 [Sediminibacterium sp.]|nr:hypothetical protein [Sediminibacterium sp.]
MIKTMVVFAWNGTGQAFKHIHWDATPNFEVLLFNYSGNDAQPQLHPQAYYDELLSISTEFKGRLMAEVQRYLQHRQELGYVGFFDDDLEITVSGINRLLRIAELHNLDAFQPATTPDSFTSHAFTTQLPDTDLAAADWVEIMCPFYRKNIFDAAAEFFAWNISSYGIDNYAIPFYQKTMGMDRTAVIHAVSVKHLKPVTTGEKIFSNGLSARQEGERIRTELLRRIRIINQHSGKVFPADFLKRVYEYRTFRYNKWKRDLKRWLGFKTT